MSVTLATLSIIAALAVGAISPGPSFVLVARTAAASGRRDALATALGLGSGALLFAIMALAGLHTLFSAVPWAYMFLKVAGDAYLIYLAYKIWRHAQPPLLPISLDSRAPHENLWRVYFIGLATQLSNPKTAIVFAGVFAALMPDHPPLSFYLTVPVAAFAVDAGWFAIVACLLSTPASRTAYLRYKTFIDRLASGIMGLLGAKLLSMAVTE